MWKSAVGNKTDAKAKMVNDEVVIVPEMSNAADDDWETDPDYINDVTEESQRWGGARDTGVLDMNKFREEMVKEADEATKKKVNSDSFSRGYGGKFGLESSQNDKSNIENVKNKEAQQD